MPLEVLVDRFEAGLVDITVAREDELPIAVVMGDRLPAANAMMISYLAVRSDARAGGIGAKLLDTAMDAWTDDYSPLIILAEVENPRFFSADDQRGDPVRRVRFYEKLAGRVLDIPYFLPPVAEGRPFVFGMLLMAFRIADGELVQQDGMLHLRSTLVLSALQNWSDAFTVPIPESRDAVNDLQHALSGDSVLLRPAGDFEEVRYPSLDRCFDATRID